jgi:hypothetical protein
MRKAVLLATAAALAVSVDGVAFAAEPTLASASHSKAHQVSKSAVDRASQVLYDQTDNDALYGTISQIFEAPFASYDSQAADDFTVPQGQKWTVTEVDALGSYSAGSGPATAEDVTFYRTTKKGRPGAVVATYTGLVGADNAGSFVITVPHTRLRAGHYWVSVVAHLDYTTGGLWNWENQTTTEGSSAQWQNPRGGLAMGCTTWHTESTCTGSNRGDHMFTLRGNPHR